MPDGALRRITGDQGHGSANGRQLRVRNSFAHPPVPPTPAVVDQSGGAPATSGGEVHGYGDQERKLRNSPFKRVLEQLDATRGLPE